MAFDRDNYWSGTGFWDLPFSGQSDKAIRDSIGSDDREVGFFEGLARGLAKSVLSVFSLPYDIERYLIKRSHGVDIDDINELRLAIDAAVRAGDLRRAAILRGYLRERELRSAVPTAALAAGLWSLMPSVASGKVAEIRDEVSEPLYRGQKTIGGEVGALLGEVGGSLLPIVGGLRLASVPLSMTRAASVRLPSILGGNLANALAAAGAGTLVQLSQDLPESFWMEKSGKEGMIPLELGGRAFLGGLTNIIGAGSIPKQLVIPAIEARALSTPAATIGEELMRRFQRGALTMDIGMMGKRAIPGLLYDMERGIPVAATLTMRSLPWWAKNIGIDFLAGALSGGAIEGYSTLFHEDRSLADVGRGALYGGLLTAGVGVGLRGIEEISGLLRRLRGRESWSGSPAGGSMDRKQLLGAGPEAPSSGGSLVPVMPIEPIRPQVMRAEPMVPTAPFIEEGRRVIGELMAGIREEVKEIDAGVLKEIQERLQGVSDLSWRHIDRRLSAMDSDASIGNVSVGQVRDMVNAAYQSGGDKAATMVLYGLLRQRGMIDDSVLREIIPDRFIDHRGRVIDKGAIEDRDLRRIVTKTLSGRLSAGVTEIEGQRYSSIEFDQLADMGVRDVPVRIGNRITSMPISVFARDGILGGLTYREFIRSRLFPYADDASWLSRYIPDMRERGVAELVDRGILPRQVEVRDERGNRRIVDIVDTARLLGVRVGDIYEYLRTLPPDRVTMIGMPKKAYRFSDIRSGIIDAARGEHRRYFDTRRWREYEYGVIDNIVERYFANMGGIVNDLTREQAINLFDRMAAMIPYKMTRIAKDDLLAGALRMMGIGGEGGLIGEDMLRNVKAFLGRMIWRSSVGDGDAIETIRRILDAAVTQRLQMELSSINLEPEQIEERIRQLIARNPDLLEIVGLRRGQIPPLLSGVPMGESLIPAEIDPVEFSQMALRSSELKDEERDDIYRIYQRPAVIGYSINYLSEIYKATDYPHSRRIAEIWMKSVGMEELVNDASQFEKFVAIDDAFQAEFLRLHDQVRRLFIREIEYLIHRGGEYRSESDVMVIDDENPFRDAMDEIGILYNTLTTIIAPIGGRGGDIRDEVGRRLMRYLIAVEMLHRHYLRYYQRGERIREAVDALARIVLHDVPLEDLDRYLTRLSTDIEYAVAKFHERYGSDDQRLFIPLEGDDGDIVAGMREDVRQLMGRVMGVMYVMMMRYARAFDALRFHDLMNVVVSRFEDLVSLYNQRLSEIGSVSGTAWYPLVAVRWGRGHDFVNDREVVIPQVYINPHYTIVIGDADIQPRFDLSYAYGGMVTFRVREDRWRAWRESRQIRPMPLSREEGADDSLSLLRFIWDIATAEGYDIDRDVLDTIGILYRHALKGADIRNARVIDTEVFQRLLSFVHNPELYPIRIDGRLRDRVRTLIENIYHWLDREVWSNDVFELIEGQRNIVMEGYNNTGIPGMAVLINDLIRLYYERGDVSAHDLIGNPRYLQYLWSSGVLYSTWRSMEYIPHDIGSWAHIYFLLNNALRTTIRIYDVDDPVGSLLRVMREGITTLGDAEGVELWRRILGSDVDIDYLDNNLVVEKTLEETEEIEPDMGLFDQVIEYERELDMIGAIQTNATLAFIIRMRIGPDRQMMIRDLSNDDLRVILSAIERFRAVHHDIDVKLTRSTLYVITEGIQFGGSLEEAAKIQQRYFDAYRDLVEIFRRHQIAVWDIESGYYRIRRRERERGGGEWEESFRRAIEVSRLRMEEGERGVIIRYDIRDVTGQTLDHLLRRRLAVFESLMEARQDRRHIEEKVRAMLRDGFNVTSMDELQSLWIVGLPYIHDRGIDVAFGLSVLDYSYIINEIFVNPFIDFRYIGEDVIRRVDLIYNQVMHMVSPYVNIEGSMGEDWTSRKRLYYTAQDQVLRPPRVINAMVDIVPDRYREMWRDFLMKCDRIYEGYKYMYDTTLGDMVWQIDRSDYELGLLKYIRFFIGDEPFILWHIVSMHFSEWGGAQDVRRFGYINPLILRQIVRLDEGIFNEVHERIWRHFIRPFENSIIDLHRLRQLAEVFVGRDIGSIERFVQWYLRSHVLSHPDVDILRVYDGEETDTIRNINYSLLAARGWERILDGHSLYRLWVKRYEPRGGAAFEDYDRILNDRLMVLINRMQQYRDRSFEEFIADNFIRGYRGGREWNEWFNIDIYHQLVKQGIFDSPTWTHYVFTRLLGIHTALEPIVALDYAISPSIHSMERWDTQENYLRLLFIDPELIYSASDSILGEKFMEWFGSKKFVNVYMFDVKVGVCMLYLDEWDTFVQRLREAYHGDTLVSIGDGIPDFNPWQEIERFLALLRETCLAFRDIGAHIRARDDLSYDEKVIYGKTVDRLMSIAFFSWHFIARIMMREYRPELRSYEYRRALSFAFDHYDRFYEYVRRVRGTVDTIEGLDTIPYEIDAGEIELHTLFNNVDIDRLKVLADITRQLLMAKGYGGIKYYSTQAVHDPRHYLLFHDAAFYPIELLRVLWRLKDVEDIDLGTVRQMIRDELLREPLAEYVQYVGTLKPVIVSETTERGMDHSGIARVQLSNGNDYTVYIHYREGRQRGDKYVVVGRLRSRPDGGAGTEEVVTYFYRRFDNDHREDDAIIMALVRMMEMQNSQRRSIMIASDMIMGMTYRNVIDIFEESSYVTVIFARYLGLDLRDDEIFALMRQGADIMPSGKTYFREFLEKRGIVIDQQFIERFLDFYRYLRDWYALDERVHIGWLTQHFSDFPEITHRVAQINATSIYIRLPRQLLHQLPPVLDEILTELDRIERDMVIPPSYALTIYKVTRALRGDFYYLSPISDHNILVDYYQRVQSIIRSFLWLSAYIPDLYNDSLSFIHYVTLQLPFTLDEPLPIPVARNGWYRMVINYRSRIHGNTMVVAGRITDEIWKVFRSAGGRNEYFEMLALRPPLHYFEILDGMLLLPSDVRLYGAMMENLLADADQYIRRITIQGGEDDLSGFWERVISYIRDELGKFQKPGRGNKYFTYHLLYFYRLKEDSEYSGDTVQQAYERLAYIYDLYRFYRQQLRPLTGEPRDQQQEIYTFSVNYLLKLKIDEMLYRIAKSEGRTVYDVVYDRLLQWYGGDASRIESELIEAFLEGRHREGTGGGGKGPIDWEFLYSSFIPLPPSLLKNKHFIALLSASLVEIIANQMDDEEEYLGIRGRVWKYWAHLYSIGLVGFIGGKYIGRMIRRQAISGTPLEYTTVMSLGATAEKYLEHIIRSSGAKARSLLERLAAVRIKNNPDYADLVADLSIDELAARLRKVDNVGGTLLSTFYVDNPLARQLRNSYVDIEVVTKRINALARRSGEMWLGRATDEELGYIERIMQRIGVYGDEGYEQARLLLWQRRFMLPFEWRGYLPLISFDLAAQYVQRVYGIDVAYRELTTSEIAEIARRAHTIDYDLSDIVARGYNDSGDNTELVETLQRWDDRILVHYFSDRPDLYPYYRAFRMSHDLLSDIYFTTHAMRIIGGEQGILDIEQYETIYEAKQRSIKETEEMIDAITRLLEYSDRGTDEYDDLKREVRMLRSELMIMRERADRAQRIRKMADFSRLRHYISRWHHVTGMYAVRFRYSSDDPGELLFFDRREDAEQYIMRNLPQAELVELGDSMVGAIIGGDETIQVRQGRNEQRQWNITGKRIESILRFNELIAGLDYGSLYSFEDIQRVHATMEEVSQILTSGSLIQGIYGEYIQQIMGRANNVVERIRDAAFSGDEAAMDRLRTEYRALWEKLLELADVGFAVYTTYRGVDNFMMRKNVRGYTASLKTDSDWAKWLLGSEGYLESRSRRIIDSESKRALILSQIRFLSHYGIGQRYMKVLREALDKGIIAGDDIVVYEPRYHRATEMLRLWLLVKALGFSVSAGLKNVTYALAQSSAEMIRMRMLEYGIGTIWDIIRIPARMATWLVRPVPRSLQNIDTFLRLNNLYRGEFYASQMERLSKVIGERLAAMALSFQGFSEYIGNRMAMLAAAEQYLQIHPGDYEGAIRAAIAHKWATQGKIAPEFFTFLEKRIHSIPLLNAITVLTITPLRILDINFGYLKTFFDRRDAQSFAPLLSLVLLMVMIGGMQSLPLIGDVYKILFYFASLIGDTSNDEHVIIKENMREYVRRLFGEVADQMGLEARHGWFIFECIDRGIVSVILSRNYQSYNTFSDMMTPIMYQTAEELIRIMRKLADDANMTDEEILMTVGRFFNTMLGRFIRTSIELDKASYIDSRGRPITDGDYSIDDALLELLLGKRLKNIAAAERDVYGGGEIMTTGDAHEFAKRLRRLTGLVLPPEILQRIETDVGYAEYFRNGLILTYYSNGFYAQSKRLKSEMKRRLYSEPSILKKLTGRDDIEFSNRSLALQRVESRLNTIIESYYAGIAVATFVNDEMKQLSKGASYRGYRYYDRSFDVEARMAAGRYLEEKLMGDGDGPRGRPGRMGKKWDRGRGVYGQRQRRGVWQR